jgi:hypothetical protein
MNLATGLDPRRWVVAHGVRLRGLDWPISAIAAGPTGIYICEPHGIDRYRAAVAALEGAAHLAQISDGTSTSFPWCCATHTRTHTSFWSMASSTCGRCRPSGPTASSSRPIDGAFVPHRSAESADLPRVGSTASTPPRMAGV